MANEMISDFGVKYSGAKKDNIKKKVLLNAESKEKTLRKKSLWVEPNWVEFAVSNPLRTFFFMKCYEDMALKPKGKGEAQESIYKNMVLFLKNCFENESKYPFNEVEQTFKNYVYQLMNYVKQHFSLKEDFEVLANFQIVSEKKRSVLLFSLYEDTMFERYQKMGFGKTKEILIKNKVYHIGKAYFRRSKDKESLFAVFLNNKFMKDETGKQINYFETESEAVNKMAELIKEDYELHQLMKSIKKTIARKKPLDGECRVGKDVREGQDISIEEFVKKTGYIGLEFGNWTNQEERQQFINCVFDAFSDLTEILELPINTASLFGTLGIAFGSRGNSKASAHFEPDNDLIHITKTKAIGSLAHEFAHAIDYYMKKQLGLNVCLSEITGNTLCLELDNIELFEAVDKWRVAINNSNLMKHSKMIDSEKGKQYYSTFIELFARCFEQYIKLELIDKKQNNNFLVYDVTPSDNSKIAVYPIGEEREELRSLMKEIIMKISVLLK